MSGNFSFAATDIEHIICNTNNMVPGIKKVMAVYLPEHNSQPEALVATDPFSPEEFCDFHIEESLFPMIEKLRSEGIGYLWYSPDDIPFITETKKIVQFKIDAPPKASNRKNSSKSEGQYNTEDEMSRNILMVTLRNEVDSKNDLIFYFFNKNLSNFKLSDADSALDHKNKTVIGTIMQKTLNFIAETCRNDRRVMKTFNQTIRNNIYSLKKSVLEKEKQNTSYYASLLNYTNEILHELSVKSKKFVFELSESARLKLKDYHGGLRAFRTILKDAAENAGRLYSDLHGQTVIIEDYNLSFSETSETDIISSVHMNESKYDKTIILLDRLEEAAKVVKQDRLPLTGANVGKACKKSMTAPAISDALDNHRSKIKKVMAAYKDRWTIIRNEFRPVQNVLVSRDSAEEQAEKQA